MKKSILLLLLLVSSTIALFSQSDNRLAKGITSIKRIAPLPIPSQNTEALLAEELSKRTSGRAPKYAVNIQVNFTPQAHGLWEDIKGDKMVSRMKIKSSGAEAINLGFTKYNMPRGGQLFLYSSDYQEVFGPFTPADNEEHEQLWTPNIKGDEIVIEIQIPKSEYNNLDIELGFVNHAFQKFSSAALLSGSCNLDVICGTADGWGIVEPHRDIIQSVAVISTGGGTFCTGFLISNANQDCTPLFMTANHCGIGAGNAASLVTYWNFFNSTCRQPNSGASGNNGDGSLADFNTGAIFRATNAASDFSIVELDDPVSETANAYFAGYDASGAQASSAIGVHHPSTDEKRISFEDDPTQFTTYGSGNPTANYTHVQVVDWDTGTTEGGSSGSPLFDQDERIIGQLHGGGAACGNNSSDWYGSLAVSWEGGGTPTTRVRDWLDPNNTGTLVNNGYYAGNCSFSVLATPGSQDVCPPANAVYDLTISDAFTSNVTLSTTGLAAGLNASFSSNNVTPGSSITLTISNTSNATAGNYSFTIEGTDGTNNSTNTLAINVLPSAGSAPTYTSPNNGAAGQDPFTALEWNGVAGVDYNIEIATNASFSNIIETATVTGGSYNSTNTGDGLTTYFWRISASSPCGNGPFGSAWSFTTADIQCVSETAANLGLAVGPNNGNTTTSVLNISEDAIITDVNVVGLDLTHSWINDLSIVLTSPTGQQVQLLDPICNDEDNMMMTFDDEAASVFADIPCPPTNGQSYQPFSPLSAFNGLNAQGDWTLTITDNADEDGGTLAGWNLQMCFEAAAVPDLVATAEVTENNECFGEEEGVIVVTASEGTPPYTYSIDGSPFQNDEFFEELGAGTYSVTAMDATGMTVTINNLTVTHPADVSATVSVNQDDATVNANGGTAPFTYSIDGTNFQTGNTFNNLDNGDYTVFVEDFNGCSVEESFTIAVNSVTLSAEISQTMLCFNDNNAIITAIAGGGQAPYTYSITGGGSQNNGTFDNLSGGTYQITVTDNDGFSQTIAPIIINSPTQLNIAANVNENDMTAMASGGTGALMYSIDGTNYQANTQFTDLDNGNYTLFVQDANGCIEETSFTISVNSLVVSATFERISCFDDANGSITVNASGGSMPYSYSLNGGTAQSSNTFSPLGPDVYEITVTDNDGFTQTTPPITLTNPDEVVLAALVDENEITAFGNGGTGDLLYSINGAPYQSNNIFSNLNNGVYTVSVIDENECIATQEVTIAVNNLVVSAESSGISCNGANDGSIVANAGGGQEPYMYSIDGTNFQDSQFFNGLNVGTYEVTVQDADGFTQVTNSVSITEPTAITVSANTVDNEITVSANGGTGAFQYSIDGINFQASNVFSGLANGSYTITVFDENECTETTTAIVAVNSLVVSAESSNISCNGANDGSIVANAGGGQEPYMYSIDGTNFQDSQFFNGLNVGTYEVTVQDADGFTQVTNSVSITEPTAITVSANTTDNEITISANGGTGAFQYSIDGINFQASNVFSGLANGSYTITVFDENECTETTTAIVAVNGLVVSAESSGISCNGANDGSIVANAGGGQEPYMYSIDGTNFQDSQFFNGLNIGTYEVTVQDADDFTQVTNSVSITEPTAITVSANTVDNEITVSANGGTGAFQYSIDGINFQASNVFSGLTNGSYTITVFDENECTETTTAIVAVNGLVVSAESSGISCNGANDGSIVANAGGGQEPYMYSIDGTNFQDSQFFNGLNVGTYEVTVQDSDGFTQVTNSVSITEPTAITVSANTIDNEITVSANGGTGSFQYSIDGINFQASNVFSGLANGSYTITVFDENECTETTTAIVAVNGLIVSAESSDISCNGANDGSIVANAGGGQEPYMYSIDGTIFQDSQFFNGLNVGTYEVTVQDADGFTQVTNSVSITEPTAITVSANTVDNEITVSANGGTGAFQYSIDGINFQASNVFSGLANGSYTITVIDENECTETTTAIVAVNGMVVSAQSTDIICNGDNNGTITASAGGGQEPYMYSIDGENFQMSNSFAGLSPGTYEITVQDAGGFTQITNSVSISEPIAITAFAIANNDAITVNSEGGTGDFQYSIDGVNFQTSNIFTGLTNGTYTISVQDANGCLTTTTATIAINSIVVTAQSTDYTCNDANDGTITAFVSGGQEPYTYSIDGINFQDSNLFEGVEAGTYEVTVQDADGFTSSFNTVSINNPAGILVSASTNNNQITVEAEGGIGDLEYSIDGVNFQTSNTFSDLANGTYTVSVQDANGCLETTTAIISIDSLAISTEATNISCHDENDGTITAFLGGGQEPFMYSIDGENFQDSPTFDNLAEGEYTITAQDANGASVTSGSISILNPEELTVSVVVEDDIIAAVGTGGILNYMYSIDGINYQESAIFNDVSNGTYTVYIIDANECMNTVETNVAVNNVSGSAAISSQISCFGDSNGAINVSATGGNEPYQYSIDGGITYQMDNFFGGLSAGEYAFTILDNDGFTFTTTSVILSQPTELQANSSVTDNNITIMAEGGIAPYSYSINEGEFTMDNVFEDLVNGNYDIIIQDFNGCEVFLTEIINVNTMSISLTIESNISCFNEEDGTIIVNVMGGTAPFMYSIDGENFQESNIFMDLSAGTYSFTITDAQGALTETTAVLLSNPEQLFINASTLENSATLNATGGAGDYLYSVDGETFQSSGEFPDLVNGDYIGYVQDANGCISETEFTIMSFALFAVAEVTQNIDCFGGKTGTIEINASGGAAPYTYSIEGFSYQTSNTFTDLSAGTYMCYAQDDNGTIYETETVTIIESDILVLNAQGISSTIIASASGGVAPFQFSIDEENFQDSGTFINLPGGEYVVTVIDALGCTQTLTIDIDVVGTEDITNIINFTIYPNPNMGTFSIDLENEMRGDLTISLYNIIGQRLYEGTAVKSNDLMTYKISDLELPAGTYEVLVKGGDYFGMKKVVVVR